MWEIHFLNHHISEYPFFLTSYLVGSLTKNLIWQQVSPFSSNPVVADDNFEANMLYIFLKVIFFYLKDFKILSLF